MDFNIIAEAVRIIEDSVLTPVIYMAETDFKAEFICFCGAALSEEEAFGVGDKLTRLLDKPTELVDISEYNENDRLEIIQTAELVYSEDPLIEQMFTLGMAEEYRRVQEQKKSMLRRMSEIGTYYLQ